MHLRSLVFFLLFFDAIVAAAQDKIPIEKKLIPSDGFGMAKTVVKLDPLTRIAIGNIPFDRTFILRIYFDPKTGVADEKDDAVSFFFLKMMHKGHPTYEQLGFYKIKTVDTDGTKYDGTDGNLKAFPSAIDVVVKALEPNRDYKIVYLKNSGNEDLSQYVKVFELLHEGKQIDAILSENTYISDHNNDKEIIKGMVLVTYYNQHPEIGKILNKYKNGSATAVKEVTAFIITNNSYKPKDSPKAWLFLREVEASSINTQQFTVQTSAGLRIIADGGLIFTGFQSGFNTVCPYLGINFAIRPMDSDIPFRQLIKNRNIHWYERFTVNLGLTLNSITKQNYRANLFGNDNVMLGLGFKLSHVFNVNFGGLIYNNVDPNPLLDKKTLGVAPYVGVSINLKIKDALGDIAKAFGYAK